MWTNGFCVGVLTCLVIVILLDTLGLLAHTAH